MLVAFVTSRSITRAERTLRIRQHAIESSMNAIIISSGTKPNNPIEYINPAFFQITGYTSADATGRNWSFLLGNEHEQPGVGEIFAAFREQNKGHAVLRNFRKDGSPFWNDLYVAPVRDETGKVTHFVSIMNDITETKNYEKQLEHQNNYDTLTELANNNLLRERMKQAITYARRRKVVMVVALLDLDNFRLINESIGHKAGDELLKIVAGRIKSCVRESDTVARVSGDEFAVILPDQASAGNVSKVLQRIAVSIATYPHIAEVLQKILSAVSQPTVLMEQEVDITCSMGVSLYPWLTGLILFGLGQGFQLFARRV